MNNTTQSTWNIEDTLNLAYDVKVNFGFDAEKCLMEVDKITMEEGEDEGYIIDRLATHIEANTDISYNKAVSEVHNLIAINNGL